MEKITTVSQASKRIEVLSMIVSGLNGRVMKLEDKERRVAFGLATKMVFFRYMSMGGDPCTSVSYWKEVTRFFIKYERQQLAYVFAQQCIFGGVL